MCLVEQPRQTTRLLSQNFSLKTQLYLRSLSEVFAWIAGNCNLRFKYFATNLQRDWCTSFQIGCRPHPILITTGAGTRPPSSATRCSRATRCRWAASTSPASAAGTSRTPRWTHISKETSPTKPACWSSTLWSLLFRWFLYSVLAGTLTSWLLMS